MEKKFAPCCCTIILGIGVLVFTWWSVGWATTALTVIGILVILKGIIGKCCCSTKDKCCD